MQRIRVLRNLLPRTKEPTLCLVVVVLSSSCLLECLNYLHLTFYDQWGGGYALIGVFFWLPLACGLWMLRPSARRVVVLVLWFLIVVLPVGIINPFTAMDELGPDPPSAWVLAAWVYPFVGLGVFFLHVLGKYRCEFVRSNEKS